MKKIVFSLLFIGLSSASLFAQEVQENTTSGNDYNKWSIDINGGFNKAANPFTPGYRMDATNLFHADLGVRYMFNTKFGLKLDAGYDLLREGDNSADFETKHMRVALQGYANLGRIMEFESWTQRLGLLAHMGAGMSQFTNDNFDGQDQLGNILLGLTAQYKISNRIALNADFTMINNFSQQHTWDGGIYDSNGRQGFDSTLYNATIGLSIYLGKNEQHADWFIGEKYSALDELEKRIGEIETMMNDSDKDGVPDYLDAEPNSITGVAVDSKGRTIDRNGNGVPDELESYIDNRTSEIVRNNNAGGSNLETLINGGYVNVYFDFNSAQPNSHSTSSINFLVKYLKDNPSATSDVIGYADEIGNTEYNRNLSARRAENVKKILVDAGIDGSRLNVVGNGEDNSVNKNSGQARQIVRRVTFILK